MLSGKELKRFRMNRELSIRDVAHYANLSISTISDVENGVLNVTQNNHKKITDGINKAFFAKANGNYPEKAKKKSPAKEVDADDDNK